jgi:hypothetical protein
MNQFEFEMIQELEGNVDDTNPEDLLASGEPASMVLAGEQPASPEFQAAALNLGTMLIKMDALVLAGLVTHYADKGGLPASVSNVMVKILEQKIKDSEPDALNLLISEAKRIHVWPLVKAAVLQRNEEIAQEVLECDSLEALAERLPLIATSSDWLPGPVYQAASHVLCSLAEQAGIAGLDAVVELAKSWRLLRAVLPVVKQRNNELIAEIEQYKATTGYVMQQGSHKMLVDNPLRALRMADSGYEFIRQ